MKETKELEELMESMKESWSFCVSNYAADEGADRMEMDDIETLGVEEWIRRVVR